MDNSKVLPIRTETDVVMVRQVVRTATKEHGFSLVDQTKIVTAASELARNTLIHGGGGEAIIAVLNERGKVGIRLTFRDEGPGIENMDLALKDGYTTGSGLGLGLSGSKRLMNEFEIISQPGAGTQVTVIRWK